jgi:hypothetical protein
MAGTTRSTAPEHGSWRFFEHHRVRANGDRRPTGVGPTRKQWRHPRPCSVAPAQLGRARELTHCGTMELP